MSQCTQICLILFSFVLCKTIVLQAYEIGESYRRIYCEIFENVNFDGESLQIHESEKVANITQITQSWKKSSESTGTNQGDIMFHSFKLPSIHTPEALCVINGCTRENFSGNCTVFKVSRKKIESFRLKSFECKCLNENTKENETRKRDESCESAKENSSFLNFTKLGKKIVGVGRNYVWHKTDLSMVVGNGSSPNEPIIFLKPTTSYLSEGSLIHLPKNDGVIYFELELGVVIGKVATNVPEANALDYVSGYALALDMTAKEGLKSSITNGLPWVLSKGFDGACPIGAFIPKECLPDPLNAQLTCNVNSVVKQNDSTSQMIFKIPQLISYISQYMTLEPNDVILTGTPDGFGPVYSGDVIEGSINQNLATIKFVVA